MTSTLPLMLMLLAVPDQAPPTFTTLALQGIDAVPLLEVSRPPQPDGSDGPLRVGYWAGTDPEALGSASGRAQEQERMRRVFEAFRVWSVTSAIYDVTVWAVVGGPAGRFRLLKVKWTRNGPQTWDKGEPAIREVMVPKLAGATRPKDRDKAMEADTLAAALAFATKLDARRYQDAWNAASAQLRASGPLEDFNRAMQMISKLHGPVSDRKPIAWLYPAANASVDGALVMVRFVTTTDDGEGIEDVAVRRETDNVWRVAGYTPRARIPKDRADQLPKEVQHRLQGNHPMPMLPSGK